jgi:vacuolar protein sorting-associated protein 3
VLVSYFPDLRGGLFTPADSIDLFAGVAERMPTESSVDEISESLTPKAAISFLSAPVFFGAFASNLPTIDECFSSRN